METRVKRSLIFVNFVSFCSMVFLVFAALAAWREFHSCEDIAHAKVAKTQRESEKAR